MTNKLLVALLITSCTLSFAIEATAQTETVQVQPSWLKKAKQTVCGTYLVTKAKESNCTQIAQLLRDARQLTASEFIEQSEFAFIFSNTGDSLNEEIKQILFDIYNYKHLWAPCNEYNYKRKFKDINAQVWSTKLDKMRAEAGVEKTTQQDTIQMLLETKVNLDTTDEALDPSLFERRASLEEIIDAIAMQQRAKEQRIEKDVSPYSLEDLLRKAESKITTLQSASEQATEID
jgi:hypothetical protein